MPSASTRRLAALSGLAGALLFFTGDMLFYGHLGSGANFHEGMLNTVAHASDARLYIGGLVGPIAACLCIIGFWQVSQNILPPDGILSRLTLVLFAILMIFGSAIHALWTAHGLSLKYCSTEPAPCSTLVASITSYWTLAYNLGSIPAYLGSILLFILVLLRKTNYPRWAALFNPAILLVVAPLADKIPAPFGAILSGGSTNLSIALFFFVSLATTWNLDRKTTPMAGDEVLAN